MSDYCRTPQPPGPCLCAWPSITPDEYAQLLEARRVHVVAQYREGARIAYDPASAHRMADWFQGCHPQHLHAEGDPVFITPQVKTRPLRDPDETARAREWKRQRRLEQARATVARLAPEFETTRTLDHGELSIPGRTGKTITDAALDRWRTYQAAQATIRRLAGLLAKENQS